MVVEQVARHVMFAPAACIFWNVYIYQTFCWIVTHKTVTLSKSVINSLLAKIFHQLINARHCHLLCAGKI